MATIRRRLTLWYTVALAVTVLAFGTALYFARRQASVRELDQRLSLEADLAQRWLAQSYRVLGRIVTTANLNPALDPGISAYLEAARDYLVVADTTGYVLALSDVTRTLNAPTLERLTAPLDTLPITRHTGVLALGPPIGSVRYLVVPVTNAGPAIGGVLVATPTRQASFGPSDLLQSMLLIAPLIMVGAGLLGYWLAG
ncbi:MAG TPA: hypothetical protein VHL09_05350, partial [Dehalococcoidia bacterium]|nr:hypothetical protein [Dehalococcoidia bacterium]